MRLSVLVRVYKLLRLRAPMSRGRGEGVRWQSSPVHVMIALFRVVPDVWRARKLSLRLFACLSFRARARAHAHTHTHSTHVTPQCHCATDVASHNRHAPPTTRGLNRFRRRRLLRLGEGGTPLSVWSRNGRVGRGASLFTWVFIGGKTAISGFDRASWPQRSVGMGPWAARRLV